MSDQVKQEWREKWESHMTGWHRSVVDANLQHYFKDLTRGNPNVSVLVPFCGKTLDLLWLTDQGCNVVGAELSEIAVKAIFEENNIPYTVAQEGPFFVYQAKEKKLKVLAGDFLLVTAECVGTFEAVWDINAFGAAQPEDRHKYLSVIASVLKPGGRVLLCNWEYGEVERTKAPFSLSKSLVKDLYQDKFDVEFLKYSEIWAETFTKKFGVDWAHEVLNILTKK